MKTDWTVLAHIANIRFERELIKIEQLRKQSARLAEDQAKLSRTAEQARNDLRGLHPSLSLNGDVHWQSWLSKSVRTQKIEEARLRVQMETHMPAVRRAFGQKQVAEKLATQQTKSKSRYSMKE